MVRVPMGGGRHWGGRRCGGECWSGRGRQRALAWEAETVAAGAGTGRGAAGWICARGWIGFHFARPTDFALKCFLIPARASFVKRI